MSGNRNDEKISTTANIFEWLEMIILSACAVLLAFTFLIRPAKVDGASMENTLHDSELLLISDLFFEPERGDILVFQKINAWAHPDPIVKRVIATEGETIDIDFDTWTVTVTDKDGSSRIIEEDYIKLLSDRIVTSDLEYPITLGEDELFVMGDNRYNSMDSRDSRIGIVKENEIIGKVLCRIFPFDKIATFN